MFFLPAGKLDRFQGVNSGSSVASLECFCSRPGSWGAPCESIMGQAWLLSCVFAPGREGRPLSRSQVLILLKRQVCLCSSELPGREGPASNVSLNAAFYVVFELVVLRLWKLKLANRRGTSTRIMTLQNP